MSCIVHYDGTFKYSELKLVTHVMIKQICEAKAKHEECKDEHCEQCYAIPEDLSSNRHMIHVLACYTKFTRELRGTKSKRIQRKK